MDVSSAFFVRECKELTGEAILFVSGRVGREEKGGRVGGRVPASGCPPPWWVSRAARQPGPEETAEGW